jgi:Zn-dependent protease with chaperone function
MNFRGILYSMMTKRKSFPSISPAAWEHPADKAALSAFAAIPGASDLVRRVVGSTTERSLRLAFLGGAARVSEAQFPSVNRLVREAASILDLAPCPEVYVKLGIEPGAFTYGVEKPFIVLTSGALDLWDEEELLGVIGHEMGHILSGHAAYKTLLGLILKAQSALSDGIIGAAAFMGLTAALREWDRKSELSADRAGLLAVQDSQSVYRALMKSAGGPRASEMDVNEFFRQASEYDASAEGLDTPSRPSVWWPSRSGRRAAATTRSSGASTRSAAPSPSAIPSTISRR